MENLHKNPLAVRVDSTTIFVAKYQGAHYKSVEKLDLAPFRDISANKNGIF